MAEATAAPVAMPKAKSKPKPVAIAPGFEIPKFEMPKMEMPSALREVAEKSIAQAKDQYEKIKNAAEEATDVLEDTYATASKGACGYGLKVIESARVNTNAAFDLFEKLTKTKSYSEAVELSTAYLREQFDTMTVQAKELAECAQKVATDTAEPIKEGLSSAFNKAA